MSGGVEVDLSGHWMGLFNFPHSLPPGPFEAEIRDLAGAITGVTTEPGCNYDPPGTILDATIEGRREGSVLTFQKTYADELRPDVVFYHGVISPGGEEIEGEWTIPGEWSGTFLMIRASGAKAAEERRVSEKV